MSQQAFRSSSLTAAAQTVKCPGEKSATVRLIVPESSATRMSICRVFYGVCLPFPVMPGLCRASTTSFHRCREDVDDWDKPGHDELCVRPELRSVGQITSGIPKILSSPVLKNIRVFRTSKSVYMFAVPCPSEGRFAVVTDVGRGMRWTWKCP